MTQGRIFFYERPDGSIFSCWEKEADKLNKRNWKQVGVSSGEHFRQGMKKLEMENKTSLDLEIEEGQVRLEKIHEEIKKLYDEELEIARGHYVIPADYSVAVINTNPQEAEKIKRFIGK